MDVQIDSFYYSVSQNHFVFVQNIRDGYVYYDTVNLFEFGIEHMKMEDFLEKYKRVGWVEK